MRRRGLLAVVAISPACNDSGGNEMAPAPAAYRSRSRMPDSRHLDLADWQVGLIVLVGSAAGLIGLLWWQLGRAD